MVQDSSSRKTFFIIGILCIVIIGIVLFLLGQSNTSASLKGETTISPTVAAPSPEVMQEYTDPAGFAFSYPDGIDVNPKKVTDETVYAKVELSSPAHEGKLTIMAQDTPITNISTWLATWKKSNKIPSATKSTPVSLEKLEGEQITTEEKIVSAAIDNGVLFTIEVSTPEESAYWKKINDTIIQTFSFKTEDPETTVNDTSTPPESSDEEYSEEVDVIE